MRSPALSWPPVLPALVWSKGQGFPPLPPLTKHTAGRWPQLLPCHSSEYMGSYPPNAIATGDVPGTQPLSNPASQALRCERHWPALGIGGALPLSPLFQGEDRRLAPATPRRALRARSGAPSTGSALPGNASSDIRSLRGPPCGASAGTRTCLSLCLELLT